jgi:hypothetical protein
MECAIESVLRRDCELSFVKFRSCATSLGAVMMRRMDQGGDHGSSELDEPNDGCCQATLLQEIPSVQRRRETWRGMVCIANRSQDSSAARPLPGS